MKSEYNSQVNSVDNVVCLYFMLYPSDERDHR